jgi:lipopolysaccharide export system permease protein
LTLVRYIIRGFVTSLAGVGLVLLVVLSLFTGIDYFRRYADQGATSSEILNLTLLQMPELLYQISPLIFLLGSLVLFLRLARTSELVVMRASGIAAIKLIAIPVVGSCLLGAGMVAAVNPFVAATMREGIALEDHIKKSTSSFLSFSAEGLWLRQADAKGQTVIQAARSNPSGTILSRVRLHRFDENGTLFARIEAPAARLIPDAWRLENATVWEMASDGRFEVVRQGLRYDLPTDLTREQILDSFSPPEMISFWKLPGFISQIEAAGFSGTRHRLYFQAELSKPVLLAAMVLIGAMFALRPARFGQTGVMVLVAVLAGFALYFLKDFAESLGARGRLPLSVAAWAPSLAAILFSVGLLLHLEDG